MEVKEILINSGLGILIFLGLVLLFQFNVIITDFFLESWDKIVDKKKRRQERILKKALKDLPRG